MSFVDGDACVFVSALTKQTYSIYTKSHTSLLLLLLSHTLCVPSCFLFRCPPHSRHGHVTGLRLEPVTHQTVNFRDKREKTLWVGVFFFLSSASVSPQNMPSIVTRTNSSRVLNSTYKATFVSAFNHLLTLGFKICE